MTDSKAKRKYKDSLFVHLFCTDQDGPRNFLDLYNALNNTNLKLEETTLKDVHIDGVLYAGQENDVSMLVDNKVVMLCEQQSTVNENMPLRCLMYIAKIYERQLSEKIRFKRKIQKIPKPEFFVFYNGQDNQPEVQTLSLREAFSGSKITENSLPQTESTLLQNNLSPAGNLLSQTENALFDLQVTVYNINNPTGKQKWEKCRALLDYSKFVNLTREEHKINPNGFMERAIRSAKKLGIMPDFLNRNAKEIENMFFGEYDYDMDIAVQREEAFEDGEHNAKIETARNLLSMGLSPEQVAEGTALPIEEVLDLQKELQQDPTNVNA